MALETAESFQKLVSKDRFLKLKDFALKMHSTFGSITCVRVHFLQWASQILKRQSNGIWNTGR